MYKGKTYEISHNYIITRNIIITGYFWGGVNAAFFFFFFFTQFLLVSVYSSVRWGCEEQQLPLGGVTRTRAHKVYGVFPTAPGQW